MRAPPLLNALLVPEASRSKTSVSSASIRLASEAIQILLFAKGLDSGDRRRSASLMFNCSI